MSRVRASSPSSSASVRHAGSVLTSLRSIVHALRGWPTPFGAGINTLETRFESAQQCSDAKVAEQLATVGRQAAQFALAFGGQQAAPLSSSANGVSGAQAANAPRAEKRLSLAV